MSNIINKVKEFINYKMGLKENSFFSSDRERKSNNDTFTPII